jgi:putative transposase
VDICAYVLMPNHFHLLLREKADGGISRFMQKLTTGYTMYFNKKNERSGALFQGRFKAKHANDDRYLSYLLAYIHLNPVKLIEPNWKKGGIGDRGKAEQYLKEYSYSSYQDYLGTNRVAGKILNTAVYPTSFSAPSDFETSIGEWLQGSTL